MKILDSIKKLFHKEQLTPLTCGSTNVETGEFSQGFLNEAGQIVYKPIGKTNVWGNPEYLTVLTITSTIVRGSTQIPMSEKKALYKQTNIYTGKSIYFYEDEGQRCYIDSNAWEQHRQIVFL